MTFQQDLDSKEIGFRDGDSIILLTDRMVEQHKHGKGAAKVNVDPEQVIEGIVQEQSVDHSLIAQSGMRITTDRQKAEELMRSIVPYHLVYAWDVRRLTSSVILVEMWRD